MNILCSFAWVRDYGSGDSGWLYRGGRESGRRGRMGSRRTCCGIMRGGRRRCSPGRGGPACGWRGSGRVDRLVIGGARLLLARRRRSRWGNRRFDDDCSRRRNYDDGRLGNDHGACRWFGNDRACGRARGNGRRSRGRNNDGRRGTRLGHNLARLGTGWRRRGRRWRLHGRRTNGGCNRRRLGAHGRMALPRIELVFLLFGLNSLEHVAGLGDMGEIDFGLDALRGARGRGASLAAGTRGALKLRANLLRLVFLQ